MNRSCNPETSLGLSDVEFTARGYYEPGFIHLRVNTCDDLKNLNRLMDLSEPPVWGSTFLHEYVHFLQDITSTHGLLNFIHFIEYLRNANKQVTSRDAVEFQIPLRIPNDFNWQTNRNLKAIYYGDNNARANKIRYSGYRKTQEEVPRNDGTMISVPKYFVDYYDIGAETKMPCHFGAFHIKEYMAHAVQKQFDPEREHDDLPYCLVELLIQKEVPRLAADPSLIIALCDASLMNYHAAQMFFQAIERMKHIPDWTPSDPESVYAFVFRDLEFEFEGNAETFESAYNRTARLAIEAFRDSLKGDVFQNNVRWFEALIAEAGKLRLNQRGFFTQLVTSPGVFSPTFAHIVNTLGIPFTTNENFNGYFAPPTKLNGLKIQPYFPKVFEAIGRTYDGQRACSLLPFCKTGNITSADCSSKPWERVGLPELCPYAQMWRTWGLQGKKPQPSGDHTN